MHVCRRNDDNDVKRFKVSTSVERKTFRANALYKLEKKKKKEETSNLKNEIPPTMGIIFSIRRILEIIESK